MRVQRSLGVLLMAVMVVALSVAELLDVSHGGDEDALTPELISSSADNSSPFRTRREANATCEPKYANMTPEHTMCLEDSPRATAVSLSQEEKDAIVQMHNDIRSNVNPTASNMMKLRWDDKLARTAQKWVMQCRVRHDNNRDEPDWPLVRVSQNLGIGHASFQALINRFYTEKNRLNYTYGGGYVRGAGHFFQLVSYEASRVGCGMALCRNRRNRLRPFRACNYAPRMDASKPPYKQGTPCADCPDHCDCSGTLCDCGGKLCYNGGEVDPATCQCQCQRGWKGENCQTLDCGLPDYFPSCRNGRYTKEDCGRIGTTVHDPNMCPHLCGLCPEPCDGLKCKNGGVLNYGNCTCSCKGLMTGNQCEICPEMDKSYCSGLASYQCSNQLPKGQYVFGVDGPLVLSVEDCPILCGACSDLCDGKKCQNFGKLNTTDCSCTCKGKFTGDTCEICPQKDDAYFCPNQPLQYCDKEPYYAAALRTKCPYKCGVCQH